MVSGPQVARAALVAAVALAAALPAPIVRAVDPPTTVVQPVPPVVPTWQEFTFYAAAGLNPIDHFECHVDDADWIGCTSPWAPGLTSGDHSIAVRAVDTDNVADPTPETLEFFVDVDPPVVSLKINEGAGVTGRYFVDLGRSYDDRAGIDEIRISNSPALDGDGLLADAWSGYDWQFGNAPGWALDAYGGNSQPGVHTVYLQARDQFGNWSEPASASIGVDPAIPSPVTIRLSAAQNPAPIGGRILLFVVAHADDGAAIRDGELHYGPFGGSTLGVYAESGAYLDASGLEPGTYTFEAAYTGSAELDDAVVSIDLQVGPALSILGPRARFVSPTPFPVVDDPKPFHLDVESKFNSAEAYQCRIDGSAWSSCDGGLDIPVLATGMHVAEVRGIDGAGRIQSEPEAYWWQVNFFDGGAVYISPGGVTPFAEATIYVDSPDWAVATRMSNSRAVDANGKLLNGTTWEPAIELGASIEWVLTDPNLGGVDADGYKFIWVQWQRADGSWTIPSFQQVRLDRAAPQLTVKVENGSSFVDEDELLVVATTSEPTTVGVYSDPEGNVSIGNGLTPNEGLDLIALPVGDVPLGTIATRHFYVRAQDLAGNLSPMVPATITIDRSSPTSTVPSVLFDVGSQVTASAVDAWVSGKATDTGSGVAKLLLQRRIGTTWTTVVTSSSSSVTSLRTLPMTSSRSFRARGTDRLGHVGSWATTTSLRPVLRGDGSSTVVYSGSWALASNSSALGDVLHRTYGYGAKATLRFTGRSIGIVTPRGPGLGRFEVWIDGVKVGIVDQRRSGYQARMLVYARSWVTAGAHTVTIRNLDTGGRQIQLDGFVVLP